MSEMRDAKRHGESVEGLKHEELPTAVDIFSTTLSETLSNHRDYALLFFSSLK